MSASPRPQHLPTIAHESPADAVPAAEWALKRLAQVALAVARRQLGRDLGSDPIAVPDRLDGRQRQAARLSQADAQDAPSGINEM